MIVDKNILKNWIILILLVIAVCLYVFRCEKTPAPSVTARTITKTIIIYKEKIDSSKKAVIKEKKAVKKLKEKKISYRVKFDSTATIDTVQVELIKADSSVILRDSIIAGQDEIIKSQDTIIEDQTQLVSMQEAKAKEESQDQKKTIRKLKRKLFINRIVTIGVTAGAISFVIIVL